ncbi:hypothetical protein SAMN05216390_12718 [Lachnospiraceae bacterium KH1T2]|nr:hypothetical protein SAMN05216390_12718 [Lachnospiraceae bacterium KH1T2]
MKHPIKDFLLTIAVIILLIAVNMICNVTHHELDTTTTIIITAILSTIFHGGISSMKVEKDN